MSVINFADLIDDNDNDEYMPADFDLDAALAEIDADFDCRSEPGSEARA